jgi:hypothetical protein
VSIDRAALIEAAVKAARRIVSSPKYNTDPVTRMVDEETVTAVMPAAIDAVLPLIADAIKAEAVDTVKWDHPEWCQGYGVGMSAAESVVRGLATRTGDGDV